MHWPLGQATYTSVKLAESILAYIISELRESICNNPYITVPLQIDDESTYNYTFPPWLINTDLAIVNSNSYMWVTRYPMGFLLPME